MSECHGMEDDPMGSTCPICGYNYCICGVVAKSTTFMVDGMDDTPIALPFPFKIGEFVIREPAQWQWFKQHYIDMLDALKNMVEIEKRNVKGDPDCLVSDHWQDKWLKQAQQVITDAIGEPK